MTSERHDQLFSISFWEFFFNFWAIYLFIFVVVLPVCGMSLVARAKPSSVVRSPSSVWCVPSVGKFGFCRGRNNLASLATQYLWTRHEYSDCPSPLFCESQVRKQAACGQQFWEKAGSFGAGADAHLSFLFTVVGQQPTDLASELRHLLLVLDFVCACSHSFQADLDHVAVSEPELGVPSHTHSLWSAGED